MVDIVACPPGAICDPIWDELVIGGTVWLWLLILVLIILIATMGLWIYRHMKMAPLNEFVDAVRLGLQQTLEFNVNRSFYIRALDYSDRVLSYIDENKISRWFVQSVKSAGRLGGISAYIVGDDFDQTKDPVVEMAVCIASEQWNKKYGEKFVDSAGNTVEGYPIIDYKSWAELLNRGLLEIEFPDGVRIPVYAPYDPLLIHKYTPKHQGAAMTGAEIVQEAKDLRAGSPEEKGFKQYLPLAAAGTVVILGLIFTFMMVTK
jgi:hypothetical protein